MKTLNKVRFYIALWIGWLLTFVAPRQSDFRIVHKRDWQR